MDNRERVIHVLLVEGFADWEPSLLTTELARQGGWRTVTVGLERGPVRSMGGFTVLVDRALGELAPENVEALVVVGSERWDKGEIPAVSRLLAAVHAAGGTVGAICGGTRAAEQAGLLAGRRYTSNAREYLPGPGYTEAAAVRDERVVTAGALGYVEFAAEMLVALSVFPAEAAAGWVSFVRQGPQPAAD
jgi:putative intracellular protease/amidase